MQLISLGACKPHANAGLTRVLPCCIIRREGIRLKFTTRDITRVGVFAALHVAAAAVLRFGGEAVVPFSLVPFMAFLAAFALGGKLGAMSLVVYTLLGLLGVPVFARAPFGGLVYLLQPTFGFVLGFIAAAWAAGRFDIRSTRGAVAAAIVAVLTLYLVGLPYFYLIIRFYLARPITLKWAFNIAVVPYIGLDFLKAGLAIYLGRRLRARIG